MSSAAAVFMPRTEEEEDDDGQKGGRRVMLLLLQRTYSKELAIQTRVLCWRPSKHGSLILSTLYVRQHHRVLH